MTNDREKSRLELHQILTQILGTNNVYNQVPEGYKMKFPAIKYAVSSLNEKRADNLLYLDKWRYTITFISNNPDSIIPDKLKKLPLCTFSRFYVTDNLNHWVFNTYY